MAKRTIEDTTISVHTKMELVIRESRQTVGGHKCKEAFNEVFTETRTRFHWKLCGLSSKLGADVIGTDDFVMKNQEIYDVLIVSEGYGFGFSGWRSRDDAVCNALEFADRNRIEIDGYESVPPVPENE